jgi:outer membrane receptor for ferrienterochelin and colicin
MKLRRSLLTLLLVAIVSMAHAGNTGKISGTVKDAQTGEALIGASVKVEGTTMGAATNIDGYYVILNIPPGKYVLVASGVGYNKMTINNVSVSIDLTTNIDITLTSTVVQVSEEVVTTAERPIIQKDLTAKTAVVGSEQISALPVTEVGEVLSLQAGFVGGSLRGGRKGEVAYWIDGVPVTDAYDGGQVVEVNKNLIQELQLVSGAFNAEYGQAMSGIVNIATKEGGANYTGGLGFYGGGYLSGHGSTIPFVEEFKPLGIRNFEGNLSGPVLGEALTFFANARYIYFDGWLKGQRRFNPSNVSLTDSAKNFILMRDPGGAGDNKVIPMNSSDRKYAQGKLTWRMTPTIKMSANYIFDDNKRKAYDQRYFYNPDGIGFNYGLSHTGIFQFAQTLNQRTFYTIGGSFFRNDLQYYMYKDPHDPRYVHPDLFQTPDIYSFYTGGTDLNRFHRTTTTWLVKADLSSQIDESDLVKVGAEFRQHKIFYESYSLQPTQDYKTLSKTSGTPFIQTEIPPQSSPYYNVYTHRPTEISAYAQDKIEFKDFILNIGLRFDYFQPDGVVLNDESDPNIYDPIKPGNRFFDHNGNGKQDSEEPNKSVEDRRAYWYHKASSRFQFSPRIGASFPITERGVIHFSYGHFFQTPRFEWLYENPDFKLGSGTGNQGIIGNADLKPEQTISVEIGAQQQISQDISVDVTMYMRDIRNLTTTGADEIYVFGGSKKYSKYQNRDFGTIKGVILTVNKRFSEGLSATLDYTFQVAKGSGSNPQQTRNALVNGTLPEIQLTALDWDQRNTLNVTLSYAAPRWGASMIAQYGSGFPYTPRASTADITTLLNNSELKPSSFNVDLRAYYEIPISTYKLVAFVRAFNLFDILNEVQVYSASGQAGFTPDQAQAEKTNPLQQVNTIEQWYSQPSWYSEPRRIEFGLNLEF